MIPSPVSLATDDLPITLKLILRVQIHQRPFAHASAATATATAYLVTVKLWGRSFRYGYRVRGGVPLHPHPSRLGWGRLRSLPLRQCHGVRRYHEDTPDGVYLLFYFAFTTDTFTSYVSLCYVHFSLFDTYAFTLEHVTTVHWKRRKGNSVYCKYSGGVLYSASGKVSSPPSSS